MSEPIPESIPTSSDRRSSRPTKKRALTPSSKQSADVDALFANPDRDLRVPIGPHAKTVVAPPEIVANVQGSSAGAGSGEFHVYKASRRREYERLRLMDEEVEKEKADREFEDRKEAMRAKDAETLSKNQAKRAKQKARRQKADKADKADETAKETDNKVEGAMSVQENGNVKVHVKNKLGGARVLPQRESDDQAESEDAEMKNAVDEEGIVIHDD